MAKRKPDTLTEDGRTARAQYLREWRKRNPEKCKQYSDRYWSRKATGDGSRTATGNREAIVDGGLTNE